MSFTREYLDEVTPAELLETLVARREKVFSSVPVVGEDSARDSYNDVVAAIGALKEVIDKLVLPSRPSG